MNIVVVAKHSTATNTTARPGPPSRAPKALAVRVTPLDSPDCQTPAIKIMKAVAEQTSKVSMMGPSMATKPSRMGTRVRAAPWASASVPMPASLE